MMNKIILVLLFIFIVNSTTVFASNHKCESYRKLAYMIMEYRVNATPIKKIMELTNTSIDYNDPIYLLIRRAYGYKYFVKDESFINAFADMEYKKCMNKK